MAKYRLGNQPEEYVLKEDYLGWAPEGGSWTQLCVHEIKNTKLTIIDPHDTNNKKTLFYHHGISKEAFPLSFFGEERADDWCNFAIVSDDEASEKFIIPMH